MTQGKQNRLSILTNNGRKLQSLSDENNYLHFLSQAIPAAAFVRSQIDTKRHILLLCVMRGENPIIGPKISWQ